jgi:hypothetical protein
LQEISVSGEKGIIAEGGASNILFWTNQR